MVRALNALQLVPHCSKGVGLSSAHTVVSHCFDRYSFEASGVPLLAGKRQALPFPHLVAAVEAMLLVMTTCKGLSTSIRNGIKTSDQSRTAQPLLQCYAAAGHTNAMANVQ